MKKLFTGVVISFIAVISLAACGSGKPQGKEAAETFMNAEFYQGDKELYKDTFGIALDNRESSVKKEYDRTFLAMGLPKEAADISFKSVLTALTDRTSYDISDVKESKEGTLVTLQVYGLDTTDFEQHADTLTEQKMMALFKEKGLPIQSLDDLATLTSDEEFAIAEDVLSDQELMANLASDILPELINGLQKSKEPTTVTLTLITNPDNKKQWTVKDREATIDAIIDVLIHI